MQMILYAIACRWRTFERLKRPHDVGVQLVANVNVAEQRSPMLGAEDAMNEDAGKGLRHGAASGWVFRAALNRAES